MVLIESGQFLLTKDGIELDSTTFLPIVKKALAIYSRYMPPTLRFNVSTSTYEYTFAEPIPRWVSDLIPVRITGVPWFVPDRFTWEYVKRYFMWRYEKPTLYVQVAGQFEVECVYDHLVVVGEDDGISLPSITEADDWFFKLLTGYFMQGVGRSRRAFTLNEVQAVLDGTELVSDGKAMEDEAYDWLKTNGKWYLAIG